MFWAFLWLAALVLFLYVCAKLIPVYIDNYQLQDEMRREARFAPAEHKDQSQIREDVYLAAKGLGISAPPQAIDVEPVAGGYRITVSYTAPFHIFDHSFKIRFHTTAESSSI